MSITDAQPPAGSAKAPILIYDGDCSFCKYWVEYFKSITDTRISYASSQEVGPRYPQIAPEEFQAAVQFIDLDGKHYRAAEAVFRSLAYAPEKRWLLWLYRYLPGFASLSEAIYVIVARNRSPLYRVTRFLWGSRMRQSTFVFTRSVFLRLLGAIYFIAFASWLPQVRGLVGTQGILPADAYLKEVYQQLGSQGYYLFPSLAWLHPTDAFLLLLTVAGIVLALLVVAGIALGPALLLLWLLYLSQVSIGRDFMAFQWDILLLEAGFLAVFFAPWNLWPRQITAKPSVALVWLLRWLVFRVFILSGAVKLASHDSTWHNLTALSYHYETQPLPNLLSWYVFQMPLWFHKVSTVLMFTIELLLPILIFTTRRFRIPAAYGMISLQVLILLTGNYCFFNLLTIALCLLLFDDAYLIDFLPEGIRKSLGSRPDPKPRNTWSKAAVAVMALLLVTSSVIQIAERFEISIPEMAGRAIRPLEPFYLTNTYGLFAVMTTTRPEIVLEGSNDGERWLAYGFKYKPGDLNKAPRLVAPHQPRLDWQMWFAALSNYRSNPWLVNVVVRLLQGSPRVIGLLATNPFPDHPPRYIRALVYSYRFTSWNERIVSGDWWARELLGTYLPPVSLRSFEQQ